MTFFRVVVTPLLPSRRAQARMTASGSATTAARTVHRPDSLASLLLLAKDRKPAWVSAAEIVAVLEAARAGKRKEGKHTVLVCTSDDIIVQVPTSTSVKSACYLCTAVLRFSSGETLASLRDKAKETPSDKIWIGDPDKKQRDQQARHRSGLLRSIMKLAHGRYAFHARGSGEGKRKRTSKYEILSKTTADGKRRRSSSDPTDPVDDEHKDKVDSAPTFASQESDTDSDCKVLGESEPSTLTKGAVLFRDGWVEVVLCVPTYEAAKAAVSAPSGRNQKLIAKAIRDGKAHGDSTLLFRASELSQKKTSSSAVAAFLPEQGMEMSTDMIDRFVKLRMKPKAGELTFVSTLSGYGNNVDMGSIQKIAAPVHFSGNHFLAAELVIKSGIVQHAHLWDALAGPDESPTPRHTAAVFGLISTLCCTRPSDLPTLVSADFLIRFVQVNKQTNGVDCGFFTLFFLAEIIRGVESKVTQGDVTALRNALAVEPRAVTIEDFSDHFDQMFVKIHGS